MHVTSWNRTAFLAVHFKTLHASRINFDYSWWNAKYILRLRILKCDSGTPWHWCLRLCWRLSQRNQTPNWGISSSVSLYNINSVMKSRLSKRLTRWNIKLRTKCHKNDYKTRKIEKSAISQDGPWIWTNSISSADTKLYIK